MYGETPQECLGASPPAPSARAELSLCSPLTSLAPLPRSPACFLHPTGDISPRCPWVGLIHAWLYVQTCASGSCLKGGEGDVPNNRGRFWGSVGSCVVLLALISLPLVQSAGLEVLTKEQKSGEGGEWEREPAFGSACACSPLSTCLESRATLFS